MCESEAGFRFESGFRLFELDSDSDLKNHKRGGFGFKPKRVDSDSDSRCPDSHITGTYMVNMTFKYADLPKDQFCQKSF